MQLNSRNFGVYAMDWTGHGGSDGLHGYVPSLDYVVADTGAFLVKIKSENPGVPLFLFGHSTVGAVVLKVSHMFKLHILVFKKCWRELLTSPALHVKSAHPIFAMNVILRKDGCLAAISERPVDFTYDNKWIEMDGNTMTNFHLALADELTSLRCTIGEQEHAELLLQSLPDSYDQLIINLTNSNVTILVFDDVAAVVLQEENRRKNKEDRQVNLQQAEALTTMRERSTKRGQSSSHKHSNTTNTSDDGDALCCEASTTVEEIIGVRTIKLKMYDGTIKIVRDVRHVKGLEKNLLSNGLLDNNASKIKTWKGIMKVFRGALVVMKGEKIATNLYMLKGETFLEAEASVASCSSDSAMLWHQKLGHMSEQGMKVLVEQKLLPGLTNVSLTLCEHCITITSLGRAKYFVSFIDEYSRRCWVYPIKKKSDMFSTFKNFKARERMHQKTVTVANTPQQNRVAERMNRTLLERTRAMLRDASLEKSFWAEAVNTACYLVNRAPSTAIELKTPIEMWTGKPTDYSNLHVFGSIVYVMYNSQEISKMDPKSKKCKFLGEDKLQRKEYDDGAEKSKTTQIHVENELEQGDSSEAEPAHDEQELESSEAPTTRQSDRLRRYPNWKSIGNKWVFKIKRNGDDQVERYHARLVVKGYAQKEEQLDVKTTFLHGNLKEEIYMLQPEGFEEKEKNNLVYKLNKSLLNADPCAYFKRSGDNDFVILVFMSPISEEERMEMSRVQYASAVGSLMFSMICTRPDIAQAVGVVSRYMVNPGKEHWNTVKRILRYIKGTSNVALCYGGSNLLINVYVDSNYASDLDKSKSITRYVFKIVGGAVSWVSKLQSVVATSTTEAEYVVATQASKEAIWLKMLLEELGHNQEYVSLFCASQSVLHLARNPTFHSRTKHIRVQCHFIREKEEEGTVDMQKIHTKDNIADFMTKAINADKFTWCRSSCGMSETLLELAGLALAPLVYLIAPKLQFKGTNKRGIPVSRDPAAMSAKYSNPLVYTGPIRVRTGHEILRISSHLLRNFKSVTIPFFVLHGTVDKVNDPLASWDLYNKAASKFKDIKLYDGFLHDLLFEPEREEIGQDIIDWMKKRLDLRSDSLVAFNAS
ncbi:lachrymatory-factor synthase-like [Hibiscus syriacus]|uniref:Lachrymatory-factor synthase-like n=1 Tax=Hibiscus syriacus TaxID=106335 RepID=A0A6A2Z6Y2_HIBSY|nr:lachrymatory-factor synthase-like [Hibiscus syriacus]